MGKLRAVVYVPGGPEADRWTAACLGYCDERGYVVVAVLVATHRGRQWMDARRMAGAELYDVLVVARWDHLPAKRRPRIEAVQDATGGDRAVSRRPRPLR